ncbi:MAG: FAD-dependent oxidoreductase [Phototrophicaceae bacterium]
MEHVPVVVVGGGIGGLTTAVHLAHRGIPPLVLEANTKWLGGRVSSGEPATFMHNGQAWSFPSEHGIHGLWGGYANLRAMLYRFVPNTNLHPIPSNGEMWIHRDRDTITRAEIGATIREGVFPAPFHTLNLLVNPRFWGMISPLDALSIPGVLYSILWATGLDPVREQSRMDRFVADEFYRLWTPNVEAAIRGLTRNMLAAPDESITLDGLISALRFYTLLRRDAWHPHFFPCNIQSALITPLVDYTQQHGGRFWQGYKLRQIIQRDDAKWELVIQQANENICSIMTDAVVLALSPHACQQVIQSSFVVNDYANIYTAFPDELGNVVIRLWFDHSVNDLNGGMLTGDFIADNYFWLTTFQSEFEAWAQQGGSAIELHLYGNRDLLRQTDAILLGLCIEDVYRAFPTLQTHLVHATLRRNSKTHTAFRVPTAHTLGVQTPWAGIYAVGDWVRHPTPAMWMERAVTTAISATNEILQHHGKQPYVVLEPPPPEPLARLTEQAVTWIRHQVQGWLSRRG